MSLNNPKNCGAVPLGCIDKIASWQRAERKGHLPLLVIHERATVEESGHCPAASITLFGRDQLLALRGAIDEALKDGESPSA